MKPKFRIYVRSWLNTDYGTVIRFEALNTEAHELSKSHYKLDNGHYILVRKIHISN